MTLERDGAMDRVFGALADTSRRTILARLLAGPQPMVALGEGLSFTRQAGAKHIRALEVAGLVRVRSVGRQRQVELDLTSLHEAEAWIRTLEVGWEDALQRLKRQVEQG